MLSLVVAAIVATAPPACSWSKPGANPDKASGKDVATALNDYPLDAATKTQLQAMMRAHKYSDIVTIKRDSIVGTAGKYTDLRAMHSGKGQYCPGLVDRSGWTDAMVERGLVYTYNGVDIVVPTICNNVALISHVQEPADVPPIAEADTPIDISPAAGMPADAPVVVAEAPTTSSEPTFENSSGGYPPFYGAPPEGGGGSSGGVPPVIPPVPPIAPVSESPILLMLLTGLGAILYKVKS